MNIIVNSHILSAILQNGPECFTPQSAPILISFGRLLEKADKERVPTLYKDVYLNILESCGNDKITEAGIAKTVKDSIRNKTIMASENMINLIYWLWFCDPITAYKKANNIQ